MKRSGTSIQKRLTLSLVLGASLLISVAGAALYLFVRTALLRQFDAGLIAKARFLGATVEQRANGQLKLELTPEEMPVFGPPGEDFFEMRRGDGRILAQTKSGANDKPIDLSKSVGLATTSPRFVELSLPNGNGGRAVTLQFPARVEDVDRSHPKGSRIVPEMIAVTVARDRGEVDRPLKVLVTSLLGVAGLLLIGMTAVVATSIRRGLRPLRQVAEEAAAINVDSLDYRFALDRMPRELRPICERLNDLLGRVGQAFQRERRFNADVAHELRTPIAELRSLSDVALKWPGDAESAAQNARDTQAIARQMEAIVTTLLSLARCQSGAQTAAREPVALSVAIDEAWRSAEPDARRRRLEVDLGIDPDAELLTDRLMLASVLGNILRNAVAYTPPGGRVACEVRRWPGELILCLGNSNDSLRREDIAHLFEPFWRKDGVRSSGSHSGLGLALVAAFMGVLGGTVAASLPAADWFEVTLTFPSAAPEPVPEEYAVGIRQ